MKKLTIVDGMPVIKQLKKFNGNPDYVETALVFLEKRKDIKRFFKELTSKIIKKKKKLSKEDKEYLKWNSIDLVETVLIGCDIYILGGRFFKKFKKVLGKEFDKARAEIKNYENNRNRIVIDKK